MTDILERLRVEYEAYGRPPVRDAIKEIERLRAASRALRDDMALQNGSKPNLRITVSISQGLWNNWCAAIGDRA
mgnify:CR=1 FL=1